MLTLDHLAVIAPTVEEGVRHVKDCIGLDMPAGGQHPQMGTHNHLLRLGEDTFLEVIAVDPDGECPTHRRWFGLDDPETVRKHWEAGRRLRGWVARTNDLDPLLEHEGDLLGHAMQLSRGELTWRFAVRPDGALSLGGAVPCVLDWGPSGMPAPKMVDLGARLVSFRLEHPDPQLVLDHYRRLGVENSPEVVEGEIPRYSAVIGTPEGEKNLT